MRATANPTPARANLATRDTSTSIAVSLRLRPSLDIDEVAAEEAPAAEPVPAPLPSRRPMSSGSGSERPSVGLDPAEPGIASYSGKRFRFAHTFGVDASTHDVFAEQHEAVLKVLKGFDTTVAVYGSTGSGKTHTMMGTEEQPGVVPLAIDALFDEIAATNGISYALQVSVLELLEERCVDLLHERALVVLRAGGSSSNSSSGGGSGSGASGRVPGGGGLVFSGLREVAVSTKAQLLSLLASANANRTVGANHRHDASSRSHLVLRLRVEGARLVRLPPAAPPKGGSAPGGGESVAGEGGEGGAGGGGAALASSMSLRDATSATLTLLDLAGSEAATQNSTHTAISQGITINKSLHWLKVAVHELAARRIPSTLRNSTLTRLLAPSLNGGAHVSLIVCSSARPATSGARDALEALAFGEVAGTVTLKPTKRTEVSGGKLGQLQSLLVQMADDREALATDAAALREQVGGYEEMIAQLKAGFVSKETLASAEGAAAQAEAALADAHARNDELARRCAEEEEAKAALAEQLAGVEAAAQLARMRNEALLERTQEASDARASLEERLGSARAELMEARNEADARESELAEQRAAVATLQEQMRGLEERLAAEREAATARDAEAAALAESNADLEARVARARDSAQAKEQLLLLRHKMYTQKQRRPSTAAPATRSMPTTPASGGSRHHPHVGGGSTATRPGAQGGTAEGQPPPRVAAGPPSYAAASRRHHVEAQPPAYWGAMGEGEFGDENELLEPLEPEGVTALQHVQHVW